MPRRSASLPSWVGCLGLQDHPTVGRMREARRQTSPEPSVCDRPLAFLSQLPDQRSAGAAMEERGQRQDGQDGEGPGHGWGRAAGSSRGERAGSTAADSEGPKGRGPRRDGGVCSGV